MAVGNPVEQQTPIYETRGMRSYKGVVKIEVFQRPGCSLAIVLGMNTYVHS